MTRQPKVILCPYCGFTQKPGCRCAACGGLFDIYSQVATQISMGPWFIRDKAKPFRPGCSYEALTKLIKTGRVKPKSILRGPTTRQFWSLARNVPGVAHLVGYCHACGCHVTPDKVACPDCAAMFMDVDERNELGLRFPTAEIAESANETLQQKLAERNNHNDASGISIHDADHDGRAPVFRNGVLFDPPAAQSGDFVAPREPDDLDELMDAQSDLGLDATGTHIVPAEQEDTVEIIESGSASPQDDALGGFADEQSITDEPAEDYEPSEATLAAAQLEGLGECEEIEDPVVIQLEDEDPGTPEPDFLGELTDDPEPAVAAAEDYDPSEATLAAAQLAGLGEDPEHEPVEIHDEDLQPEPPELEILGGFTGEHDPITEPAEDYEPSEATLVAAELEGLIEVQDHAPKEAAPKRKTRRPETPVAAARANNPEAGDDQDMDGFELGPELVIGDPDGSSMAPCPGDSPIAGLDISMTDEDPLAEFGERAKKAITGSGKSKTRGAGKAKRAPDDTQPLPDTAPAPRRVEGIMMALLVMVTVCGMGLMALFITSSGFGPKQATAASPPETTAGFDASAPEAIGEEPASFDEPAGE